MHTCYFVNSLYISIVSCFVVQEDDQAKQPLVTYGHILHIYVLK